VLGRAVFAAAAGLSPLVLLRAARATTTTTAKLDTPSPRQAPSNRHLHLDLSLPTMSTTRKPAQVARPAGRYFKGKPGAAAAADSSGSESDSDADAAEDDVEARKAKHVRRQGREMGVSLGTGVGVDSQGRVVGIKKEGASISSYPLAICLGQIPSVERAPKLDDWDIPTA